MQIGRRATERRAPVGDRAIIMRMRDRDRLQPAECTHLSNRRVGRERHAIPHHTAAGVGNEQRTLADGKMRLDLQPDEAEIVAPDQFVALLHLLAAEKTLSAPVHILALVLANEAGGGRRGRIRELSAALKAGPEGHDDDRMQGKRMVARLSHCAAGFEVCTRRGPVIFIQGVGRVERSDTHQRFHRGYRRRWVSLSPSLCERRLSLNPSCICHTFRFIHTAFGSVKFSSAAVPCSRPRPESRSPPQGSRTSV